MYNVEVSKRTEDDLDRIFIFATPVLMKVVLRLFIYNERYMYI